MMFIYKRVARSTLVTSAAAVMLLVSACGASSSTNSSSASGNNTKPLSIAFLAASSQNGYNQAVYQGAENFAKTLKQKVTFRLLDGQFDNNTQLSQMQNATSTSQYDGVIVVPNDGPSLAAAFPTTNPIPVVTVLNPIGPDIDKMTPQVAGVVSTVAVSPSAAAAKQAEGVVKYCAVIDPCNVIIIVGNLSASLDVARLAAYKKVLGAESNIKIVATTQGAYDRDTSLTAITNVLQAHKNVNVLLSNADQQTSGAQIAFQNAGIDLSNVYLTGGGGTKDAVKAVRTGLWQSDYINFPVSMGLAAMEQLYNAIEGKTVTKVVDADTVGGKVEPYATKQTLALTPDFTGEWAG